MSNSELNLIYHTDGPSPTWMNEASGKVTMPPDDNSEWTSMTLNLSYMSTTSAAQQQQQLPCSEDSKFFLFNDMERFALLLVGSGISVVAVVLNCLVLACFVAYPTLRSPSNIYVVHLAICDLFVGFNSLPSRVIIDFVGCWPLPLLCCRISQVLHWVTVQQSAFCMVLIAYDRYLMLRLGSAYAARETTTVVWRRVMLFWLLNALIWTPLNLMHLFTETSASSPGKCNTEFLYNGYVAMPMFFWANFVTPAMLLLVYSLVFAALRRRTQHQLLHQPRPSSAVGLLPTSPSALLPPQPLPPPANTLTAVNMATTMLLSPYNIANGESAVVNGTAAAAATHHRSSMSSMTQPHQQQQHHGNTQQMTRTERLLARQRRALRSMIVLTVVFLLTWLPEGILGITYKAYCSIRQCYGDNTDPEVFEVYYGFVKATMLADYLLLANAALNPALYALAFPSIREAMMRLTLPKRLYLHWLDLQRNKQKQQQRKQQQHPNEITHNHIISVGAPSRHQTNFDATAASSSPVTLLNNNKAANKKYNIDMKKLSNGTSAIMPAHIDQEEISRLVDEDDDEGGTLTAVRRDKKSSIDSRGLLLRSASSRQYLSDRHKYRRRRLLSMRLHSQTQQQQQQSSDSGPVNGGSENNNNVDELQTSATAAAITMQRRNSEKTGMCAERAWNNRPSPLLTCRPLSPPPGDAKVAATAVTTNDIEFTVV